MGGDWRGVGATEGLWSCFGWVFEAVGVCVVGGKDTPVEMWRVR